MRNYRRPAPRRLNFETLERRLTPATFFVSNNTDSGPGSFRQAIIDANQDSFPDAIVFADNVFSTPQTISLLSELPPIVRQVTITGTGPDNCIVDAKSANTLLRVFHVTGEPTMAISISGVQFQNGKSPGNIGGLALGSDSVTLNNVRVLNSSGSWGGILASGTKLTMTDVTVAGNTATDAAGGGLHGTQGAVISAQRSTFSGNTAGSAGGGGIYMNSSSLALDQCTVSGNKATSLGGGLFTFGSVVIKQSTITNNQASVGGGIRNSGSAELINTIVSGNIGSSLGPDIHKVGPLSLENCAIGSTSGAESYTDKGGNIINATLSLGLLEYNGGLTKTHALKSPSAAVNVGRVINGLSSDQRGQAFVAAPDIGAFEVFAPVVAKVDPTADITSPNQEIVITVRYMDELALQIGSLDFDDVLVTGPNGYANIANVMVGQSLGSDKDWVVQYHLSPPLGGWQGHNVGTYTASLAPNQVKDTHGWSAPAQTLSTFNVIFSQNLVVTNNADSGPGSLRQAVLDAENGFGLLDTITFDPSVTGTITLTGGELAITESLTISGPGPSKLSISGNNASRIINHAGGSSSATLNISGLTLTQARANGPGGAILMINESLTLTNCALVDNRVNTFAGPGGAIAFIGHAGGSLTITSCNINYNSSDAGGAMYLDAPQLVTNITKSNLVGNSARSGGGAIFVYDGGSLTINDSALSGNVTIGPGTRGGGVYFYGKASQFRIHNSTLSGNTANGGGGGIVLDHMIGIAEILNSTITANTAQTIGGGGILRQGGDSKVQLESSIVSNNTGGSHPDFESDGIVSAQTSAIGSKNGTAIFVDDGGNFYGEDLKLGPLADNGGGTWTHALLANSPIINKGSNPLQVLLDQRGISFVRQYAGKADIGAYESQAAPRVTSIQINDNAAQRSMVTKIQVTFSDPITFTPGVAAAFQLTRTGPSGPTGLVNLSAVQTDQRSVVLTFATGGQVGIESGGSLLDGNYQLTVLASKTAGGGGALDGNGNGTGGDNYVSPTTGTGRIFRLFGDGDGNGTVNAADFASFRSVFGLSGPSIFDANGDNQTNAADFAQFRARFGLTMSP